MKRTARTQRQLFAIVAAMLLVLASAGSCRTATTSPANESAVQGRATPRMVLTFYYPWWGNPAHSGGWVHWRGVNAEAHEITNSTHFPEMGAYDSNDPGLIDHHLKLAEDAGIDAFIASWWGPGDFTDRAISRLVDRAAHTKVKVSIYWEIVPGKGAARIDRAVADLVYVLKNYGDRAGFLRVGGKPVIFVYGRVMGGIPMDKWPEIVARAEKQAGREFLLIADGYSKACARQFDGVHTYNIAGWWRGGDVANLAEAAKNSFSRAVQLARSEGKISCLTVIPGYDDTKERKPGLVAPRHDGATYEALWRAAIAADADWILVTSFNEWHEGSEIEPSREYGDKYMSMTRSFARQFKKR